MRSTLFIGLALLVATAHGAHAEDVTHNWSGFYAGLHAGYASSDSSADLSGDPGIVQRMIDASPPFATGPFIPSALSPDPTGFVGGVQAGYNWMLNGSMWLSAWR